jgi:hypothetical protein
MIISFIAARSSPSEGGSRHELPYRMVGCCCCGGGGGGGALLPMLLLPLPLLLVLVLLLPLVALRSKPALWWPESDEMPSPPSLPKGCRPPGDARAPSSRGDDDG